MGSNQGMACVESRCCQHGLHRINGHTQIPEPPNNLCGRELFHAIIAICRVWVNFSRFKQSNLMVVAEGFDAQVCHEGKVPNAQCIAHSERFSCRLVYVLLFLERSIYSPPTGEYILL